LVVFGISRSALGKSGKRHIIRTEKSFANFFYSRPDASAIREGVKKLLNCKKQDVDDKTN